MLGKSILLILGGAAVLMFVGIRPPEALPQPAPAVSLGSGASIPSAPSIPSTPRDQTLATLINAAALEAPALAEDLLATLAAETPADARALQGYLIVALGHAGDHERAAALAAEAPPEDRTDLLTVAYTAWAQREPETALDAALMLDDPLRQRAAFQAAITGWSRQDPRKLAECAAEFPPGPEKKLALRIALRAWAETSPADALGWFDTHRAALDGISRDELTDND
jgi:hypothetical protein